jgi:hypothetical protein
MHGRPSPPGPGGGPVRKLHRTIIAHAAGHLYARCTCGWEGTHRPITRDSVSNDQALRAADRECDDHLEQARDDARSQ